MICDNCGGTFAEDAVKCPYCGALHFAGASAAYDQKIEDITDDMADLADDAAVAYKQTMRGHLKRVLIAVCLAVVVAIGVVVFAFSSRTTNSNSVDEYKAQLAWAQTTYPMLDAWYEADDFEAIIAYEEELANDKTTNYNIYDWEHYDFCYDYYTYTDCLQTIARYENDETVWEGDLISAMQFVMNGYEPITYQVYTDEELEILTEYRAEVSLFLQDILNVTAQDLEDFYLETAEVEGGVYYNNCKEFVQEHYT